MPRGRSPLPKLGAIPSNDAEPVSLRVWRAHVRCIDRIAGKGILQQRMESSVLRATEITGRILNSRRNLGRFQNTKTALVKSNRLKTQQIESHRKPFFHWFAARIPITIVRSSDARTVFDNRIAR